MKNSLQYLKIKPDESVEKAKVINVPDYSSKNTGEVVAKLSSLGLVPVVLGDGANVQKIYPGVGTKLLNGERVIVVTDGQWKMPDIHNWSLSDVMKLVHATNMQFSFEGNGFVTSQNLDPDTVITKESNLQITLQPAVNNSGKETNQTDE